MANFNMSFTRKKVFELGLQELQLIPATNPNTCKEIRYKDQVINISNKTKIEIETILMAIKGGCKNVKELKQDTNKSNIDCFINFSLNLSQVIKEYIKLQYKNDMNILENYMNSFYNFHCLNDNNKYMENIKEVENKLLSIFSNKDVIIYKDVVISQQGLKEVIEHWNKKNNKNINIDTTLNSVINKIESIC